MGSRRWTLAAAGSLVLPAMLAASTALADPTSADRETARSLMQQGREAVAKGDLKEALKRFKGADDIMHVPTTALEVARTLVSLGQLVEARDFIAAIRQTQTRANEPQPFKDARAKADDLDASLNGRIPSLIITVKGAPDGQTPTVSVDGTDLPAGVVGLPRAVDPGHHVVLAKLATKAAQGEGKQEVDVKEGEQKPVEVAMTVTLTPEPPAPAAAPAEPEAPPAPTISHSPTLWTWVGVGLGGAGLVTGGVAGALSLSKKSSLNAECPNDVCAPGNSDYSAANTFATVSTVGFIVAGVGAGVAVVTLLVGHEVPAAAPGEAPAANGGETGLAVHPWLGLGAGGVNGTF
jgi:hypothetical protein